jgi:hypothetical protein
MNGACRTYGRNYKCLQNVSRKPKGKTLAILGVD